MARAAFWLSVLTGLVVTVVAWFVLPDRVPMHFSGSGQVDQWGTRTEAVVTMGAILGGLALLFWVLIIVIPRIPESLLNLPAPDKEWWLATPGRHAELNRRVVGDLHTLGAATLLLVIVDGVITMSQAHRPHPALGPWFWVIIAVYLVGLLGYTAYMITVRYRAPRHV
ncbi:MAG: DUF1648 domain-containing protein [Dermatophilaceae bacterium]